MAEAKKVSGHPVISTLERMRSSDKAALAEPHKRLRRVRLRLRVLGKYCNEKELLKELFFRVWLQDMILYLRLNFLPHDKNDGERMLLLNHPLLKRLLQQERKCKCKKNQFLRSNQFSTHTHRR